MTWWQQALFGLLCVSSGPIIAAFLRTRGSLRAADVKELSDQRTADIAAAGQLRDDLRAEIDGLRTENRLLRKERDEADERVRLLEGDARDATRLRAELAAANSTIDLLMKRQALQP